MGWTKDDSAAAYAEGWDIFDSDERGLEIERVDELGVFGSDQEAVEFVSVRADYGSPLHVKAMAIQTRDAG